MKRPMYSVYDSVAEIFNKPYPAHNDADALRAFLQGLENSEMEKMRQSEYALFRVGVFDDSLGEFIPETNRKIGHGASEEKVKVVM